MTDQALASELKKYIAPRFEDIQVQISSGGHRSRRVVRFVTEGFRNLYPLQRYHQLSHLVPEDFLNEHLKNTRWVELAPGESEEELIFPDDKLVKTISKNVLRVLTERGFFEQLDSTMSVEAQADGTAKCSGGFSLSKAILHENGFPETDYFDVFHVLMAKGAFCDCEILYNVAERSKLKDKYWSKRGHAVGDGGRL